MSIKDDIEAACVAALAQAETNEDMNGPSAQPHADRIRRGAAAIRRIIDKSYSTPKAAEAAHRLANGPHDHDDADGRAAEPDYRTPFTREMQRALDALRAGREYLAGDPDA